ncbi:hypothetical protein CPY51_30615 [Rhizobium tubonense]|uniref:Uncharacterized protein n=2 Tax=Rhizobium tubonense TaxID=484088 RepID=A0A2W4CA63_9HYPH|nr:hypothetical protein CPY51_30615 [Rhizobium tubonense]
MQVGSLRCMMTIWRGIFTGLGCVVALAGCSPETESPDVQKFENSELHALGASCAGPYFSVEGGNFILVEQGEKRIVQEDVKLDDLGSHRLAMTASYGNGSLVSTYTLEFNNTVAKLDNVAMLPEVTPEQLDKAKLPRDYMAKYFREVKEKMPTLVLCPRSATSTPAPSTGVG